MRSGRSVGILSPPIMNTRMLGSASPDCTHMSAYIGTLSQIVALCWRAISTQCGGSRCRASSGITTPAPAASMPKMS